jgi:hypothetical protein
MCNSGNIVGRNESVVNDQCYTSVLSVTYNPALSGETIVCTHNTGAGAMDIGEAIIPEVTTGTQLYLPTYIRVFLRRQHRGRVCFGRSLELH